MMLAHVTLIRSDVPTATIIAREYQESIPFWKITWSPDHVIFHVDETNENRFVAYKNDRVHEIVTERMQNDD